MSVIETKRRVAKTDQPPPETSSLYADRVRVYPRAVKGWNRRIKWAILCVCLGIYYVVPWLRWDRGPGRPDQAILLDIASERFYFFNMEFWPQDVFYLTGLLVLGAVSLFLVTSLFGRLWCGYTCPQTVWTDLFMLIERWVEGDRNERMRRDQRPFAFNRQGLDKAWRKAVKHAVWLGIAFWTGGAWIMYFADAPTTVVQFWSGTAALPVYIYTFLFTSTTYVLAGWAREQVCTYMCPWPRFQSAMLDEQTITVTYQAWRGEPRGHHVKQDSAAGARLGDCIDCMACVHACPTGIDIRDGIQLECINCGLCVDACNEIMGRINRPEWLITWDTLARQNARKAGRAEQLHFLRPRTFVYLGVLLVAVAVMGAALAMRSHTAISVAHQRQPLYVRMTDGAVRNGYEIDISNKTGKPADYELSLAGPPGLRAWRNESPETAATSLKLNVPADSIGQIRLQVAVPPQASHGSHALTFRLHNLTTGETASYESVFIGPN